MKITLLSDDAIRLQPGDGRMTCESLSQEQTCSPLHMLASSLACCTVSVMRSWASEVGLAADDLTIDVSWTFADNPHRVGSMNLRFYWPSLPTKRFEAAKRVAETCAVHATLEHPPEISIDGSAQSAESVA